MITQILRGFFEFTHTRLGFGGFSRDNFVVVAGFFSCCGHLKGWKSPNVLEKICLIRDAARNPKQTVKKWQDPWLFWFLFCMYLIKQNFPKHWEISTFLVSNPCLSCRKGLMAVWIECWTGNQEVVSSNLPWVFRFLFSS